MAQRRSWVAGSSMSWVVGLQTRLGEGAEPVREKKGPARQAPRKKPAGSPEWAPATHSSQVVGTQVRWGTEKIANTPGTGHRVLVFLGSPAPSVFSTTPLPPAFIVCRLFDSSHSDRHEMVPHCGFDLHFSDNE